MTDILDVLHSRWAESAAEAIVTGEDHPTLTFTTHEVADLIDYIANLRRDVVDAVAAFERIHLALDQHTAHPEARARQACTIARYAAERLTASRQKLPGPPG
ncbi:hypothetical protein GPX89_01655 [Nocardia sp. ET3-3]|uniref:Uncharacterized protein n=1 Tax=Nocardia terrae TaxID=2675851 RepID=A0A7K1UNN8_9NOCA|nr:hypothetical protein [Nocardia terrae]MVU75946.1 hypothetical protein [Nocardia terrae]